MSAFAVAPLRISFAGGGTDLPAYCDRFEGMVVSTAIQQHVSIDLREAPQLNVTVIDGHTAVPADKRTHEYVSAVFKSLDVPLTFSVQINRTVPTGTGLGASSATLVALVSGIAHATGLRISRAEIASRAAEIEINTLDAAVGRQDHHASAYGGLNVFYFSGDGVRVENLEAGPATSDWIANWLQLFVFPSRHDAGVILRTIQRDTAADTGTLEYLHKLRGLADAAREAVLSDSAAQLTAVIADSWKVKRRLPGVSTADIDDVCDAVLASGAHACKVAGAGGGGSLLVVAPPGLRSAISSVAAQRGMRELAIAPERRGVRTATSSPPVGAGI